MLVTLAHRLFRDVFAYALLASEVQLVIEHAGAVGGAFVVGHAAALVEGSGGGVGFAGGQLEVVGAGRAGGVDCGVEQAAADAAAALVGDDVELFQVDV